MAQRAGATVIDMTGALADVPEAVPWIPILAKLLPPPHGVAQGASRVFSAPATPVILACTLAVALGPFSPGRLAIVFFPPVSEHDQPGVDELESQAAGLLSFREISQSVFDAQVAFNLLISYGAKSRLRLAVVRSEIPRAVARC